jgi:hypothetical protein
MERMTILGLPRARASLAALALALLCFACAIGRGRGAMEPVARQGWQHARGPVVPHETFPRDCSLCHTSES